MRFLCLFIVCFLGSWNGVYAADSIKILTVIPARSGSTGIPHKNIRLLWGKPLLAWSIEQAQKSKYRDKMRIIVSTDSEEYARIANSYGAETPFIRPKKISHDRSLDVEWANHAVQWFSEHEGYVPDILLHLRPTQPCRKVEDIDNCLDLFIEKRDEYDSLRTVIRSDLYEAKMYTIVDGLLMPIFKEFDGRKEPYDGPRQLFPENIVDYYTEKQKRSVRYLHNGYIDVVNVGVFSTGSMSGERIYPYIMDETNNIDIDLEEEFEKLQWGAQ